VITQLHQEITGDEVSQMSVRQFVNDWLERRASEVAETTLEFYRNAAHKFLAFLGNRAEEDLTEVTRDHITRFRNEEAKRFAPKTVNHEVKSLRMLFRAARRDALVADDPAEFVETVRKGNAVDRRPFTIGEIKAVLRVADPEWRSMVMFGLYTRTASWRHRDAHVAKHRSRAGRNSIGNPQDSEDAHPANCRRIAKTSRNDAYFG
jgi:integrase